MNVKKALAYPAIAGILVASLAACSDDDKDKATDAANQATSAAGDAGASATSAAGDAAASATGENGAGEEGKDGASGDTKEIDGPNGPVKVPAAVADKYEELGGKTGHLGAPKGEPEKVGEGQRQDFDGGSIFVDPEGKAYLVQGKILERYNENGGPESELGWPTSDEAPQEGGWISTFQNGNITFVNGEYGE